jgi:hypothetical protein
MICHHWHNSSGFSLSSWLFLPPIIIFLIASSIQVGQAQLELAVRVVRFQVDYPDADLETVRKLPNWSAVMRKRSI